jgi:gliding motility-associated-like protein/CSLREA domain-containing protein
MGVNAQKIYIINTVDDINDGICDANHCSLREAIIASNSDGYGNLLRFEIDGTGDKTIKLDAELPPFTEPNVRIEGNTQAGNMPTSGNLILDGQQQVAVGFNIQTNDIRIFGLKIQNFPKQAILVENSNDPAIIRRVEVGKKDQGNIFINNGTVLYAENIDRLLFKANYVGTNFEFDDHLGNQNGILIRNDWASYRDAEIIIGGPIEDGDQNYFVNAVNAAINISYQGSAQIEGNVFGTDKSGKLKMGNRVAVIAANRRGRIDIGGDERTKNIFAYNGSAVLIERYNYGSVSENSFYCNEIGLRVEENAYPKPIIENGFSQVISGRARPHDFVEIYITDAQTCNSSDCQGMILLGTINADGNGKWEITGNFLQGQQFVALSRNDGRQSMFSDCFSLCPPNLSLAIDNEGPYCAGDTIGLKVTTNFEVFQWTGDLTEENTRIEWRGPNGFTASGQEINEELIAGAYSAQAFLFGCPTNLDTTEVIINHVTASIKGVKTHCQAESITLEGVVSSPIDDLEYQWTGPNGYHSTEARPSDIKESGVYSLNVSGDNCMSETAEIVISNHFPKPILLDDISTICEGEWLELELTGYSKYQWNADFPIGCDTCSSIRIRPTKNGRIQVSAGPNDACLVSDQTEVRVVQSIIKEEKMSLCPNKDLYLFGKLIEAPGRYVGTFTSSTGCDSSHIYHVSPAEGKTTIEQKVICEGEVLSILGTQYYSSGKYATQYSAQNGCDSTHIIELTVLERKETAERFTICEGEILNIFGEKIDREGVISKTFSGSNGCDSVHTVTINVNQTYRIVEKKQICAGTSIELFGEMMVSKSGFYQKRYTSQSGCDSTHIIDLKVREPINTQSELVLCEAEASTYLKSDNTFPSSFTEKGFSKDGCDSLHTTHLRIIYAKETQQEFLLCHGDSLFLFGKHYKEEGHYSKSFFGAEGCDSVHHFTLKFAPKLEVNAIAKPACEEQNNGSIALNIRGGMEPYAVFSKNKQFSNYAQMNDLEAGEYQFIIADSMNCTVEQAIKIDNVPLSTFETEVENISCFGANDGALHIYAEDAIEVSLNGGAFSKQLDFENLRPDVYEVLVKNEQGCEQKTSFYLEQPQELHVDLPEVLEIKLGESIQLIPQIKGEENLQYEWTTAEMATLSCTDCENPMASPLKDSKYQLSIYNEHCESIDEVYIKVKIDKGIYIPNAFSPNGDGHNDFFTLLSNGYGVENVDLFRIVDRWGNLVFQAQDFQPDNDEFGWDGRYKGQMMTCGVYAFFAKIKFVDGTEKMYKGDVTLTK